MGPASVPGLDHLNGRSATVTMNCPRDDPHPTSHPLLDPPMANPDAIGRSALAHRGRQAADRGPGGLGDPRDHRRRLGTTCREHPEHLWAIRPGWLLVSGLLYLVGILPEGLFWHRALRSLGQDVPLGRTLRAYYIGHLGKYVPGKAVVVVMRTGLVCGPGVDASIAAASVFLETLTMMAAGAFLAAVLLVVHDPWHSLLVLEAAGGGAAAPAAGRVRLRFRPRFVAAGLAGHDGGDGAAHAAAGLFPPGRLVGVGRSDPAVAAKLAQFRYRTLLWGWVMMFVGWGFIGASLWATLKAVGAPDIDLLRQLPLVHGCHGPGAGGRVRLPGAQRGGRPRGRADAIVAAVLSPDGG